ncbi:MAG: hypothetical protein ACK5L3_14090 [Oscillospiraceae bacterium]
MQNQKKASVPLERRQSTLCKGNGLFNAALAPQAFSLCKGIKGREWAILPIRQGAFLKNAAAPPFGKGGCKQAAKAGVKGKATTILKGSFAKGPWQGRCNGTVKINKVEDGAWRGKAGAAPEQRGAKQKKAPLGGGVKPHSAKRGRPF